MAEDSIVEFIEEYQTGFFLVLFSLVGGLFVLIGYAQIAGAVLGWSSLGQLSALGVFAGGGVATFLALSYLLYGR